MAQVDELAGRGIGGGKTGQWHALVAGVQAHEKSFVCAQDFVGGLAESIDVQRHGHEVPGRNQKHVAGRIPRLLHPHVGLGGRKPQSLGRGEQIGV